jgi:hypothetical protein
MSESNTAVSARNTFTGTSWLLKILQTRVYLKFIRIKESHRTWEKDLKREVEKVVPSLRRRARASVNWTILQVQKFLKLNEKGTAEIVERQDITKRHVLTFRKGTSLTSLKKIIVLDLIFREKTRLNWTIRKKSLFLDLVVLREKMRTIRKKIATIRKKIIVLDPVILRRRESVNGTGLQVKKPIARTDLVHTSADSEAEV